MARFSLRAFAVIALVILLGSVSVAPVRANPVYSIFEYFNFEGLPDDHCQIETAWKSHTKESSGTDWQGCNYHASQLIQEGSIEMKPRDIHIDIDGLTTTFRCTGWREAKGSIWDKKGETGNFRIVEGDENKITYVNKNPSITFYITKESSITWIYERVHDVEFQIKGTEYRLRAWGQGVNGQIGDGMKLQRPQPEPVSSYNWASITAGYDYTIGLRDNGELYSWGANGEGQLGYKTGVQATPRRIGDDKWIAVAAGENHTLAIKEDGTLWAWGKDDYGQLGLHEDSVENGWKYYKGHLYKRRESKETFWTAAQNAINLESAYLVTINDQQEHQWLIDKFFNLLNPNEWLWIGLYDSSYHPPPNETTTSILHELENNN